MRFGLRALIIQMDRERSSSRSLTAAIDACNARRGAGAVVQGRAGVLEKRD